MLTSCSFFALELYGISCSRSIERSCAIFADAGSQPGARYSVGSIVEAQACLSPNSAFCPMKLNAVLRSAATAQPRRRGRTPSLAASIPTQDLIGPPDPLSNLRPVFYAPLFPSLHQTSTSPTGIHPYSLAEFPIRSSTKLSEEAAELQKFKRRLHSEDLEWRSTRYRLDAFNQDFWTRTNTAFLQARDAWLLANPTLNNSIEPDLSPFYAQHLADSKYQYAQYNRQLWKLQASLLWPAVKAAFRPWRWAYRSWRAGIPRT